MSAIQKMIAGLAQALAGLPQADTTNHAAIASSFGSAIGAPVEEGLAEMQQQVDAANQNVEALRGELNAAIASLQGDISAIPIYTPPPPPAQCLSYLITNTATESTLQNDVQFTYRLCSGEMSPTITLFAQATRLVCAREVPVISSGVGTVVSQGQGSCPPLATPSISSGPVVVTTSTPLATPPSPTPTPTSQSFSVQVGAAPILGARLDIGDLTGDFRPQVALTIDGLTTTSQFPTIITRSILSGTTITVVATPQLRFDWRFVGWTDRSNNFLSDSVSFTTTITAATDLIARYRPI